MEPAAGVRAPYSEIVLVGVVASLGSARRRDGAASDTQGPRVGLGPRSRRVGLAWRLLPTNYSVATPRARLVHAARPRTAMWARRKASSATF